MSNTNISNAILKFRNLCTLAGFYEEGDMSFGNFGYLYATGVHAFCSMNTEVSRENDIADLLRTVYAHFEFNYEYSSYKLYTISHLHSKELMLNQKLLVDKRIPRIRLHCARASLRKHDADKTLMQFLAENGMRWTQNSTYKIEFNHPSSFERFKSTYAKNLVDSNEVFTYYKINNVIFSFLHEDDDEEIICYPL